MNLNIVDYIVIGIILIFAIIGLSKGFVKSVFAFVRKFIAIVVSFFLVKPVSNFLISSNLGTNVRTKILEWVTSKVGELASISNPTSEQITSLSEKLNIPKFICEWVLKGFDDKLATGTLGEAFSDIITHYAITIFSFIALVIVLSIIVAIISHLLNKIFETPLLKPINRLLGFAFGILSGIIVVSLIFLGLSALSSWDFLGNFITKYIDPTNTSFGIARSLYNNNFLVLIYDKIIHLEGIFS